MDPPIADTGIPATALAALDASLQGAAQDVSREFHAFCRLSPPDAAARLLALDLPALVEYNDRRCKAAVDQWLCRDRHFDVHLDVPSLTTRDSTLSSL
ncbi:hypothetical protein GP486_007861, partial [Trichoglossum hirsutum]